jgi:TRAP-type C4-dicarboxylate transport system substrate-binding protein
MERMVYERTGGRVKLKIISRMFPSNQLLQAVATGKADMTDVPMPWVSSTYPLWNWGAIPDVVNTDPIEALAEELAVYQDPKVMEIYDRTLKKVNLKFWFITQWDGDKGIFSKKKIQTLADVKGMKINIGGHLPSLGVKAMGASPVKITSSELAPAMMTGTVDGVATSLGYGYSIGLAKVSDYFTHVPLNPTWSAVTVINRKTFDSMPPDLQKALVDVGKELQRMVSLSTTAEYILSVDALNLAGVQLNRLLPDEEKKATALSRKAVEEEWLKKSGDDGKELLKAVEEAVSRYRSYCQ